MNTNTDRFKNLLPANNTSNNKRKSIKKDKQNKNKMRSNRARNPARTTRNPTKQPTQKNSRWSFIEKKEKEDKEKNVFLRKERTNSRNGYNGFKKQNLRINSRFSNLKTDDEGNSFQRRHGGGGRMNRRNRSYRPKRSKEEFLNYMAEKHNGTFKNADIMAFAKSIKPKSPNQSKKKKGKKKSSAYFDSIKEAAKQSEIELEKEKAALREEEKINASVKSMILNNYSYYSEEEEEYEEDQLDESEQKTQTQPKAEPVDDGFSDML